MRRISVTLSCICITCLLASKTPSELKFAEQGKAIARYEVWVPFDGPELSIPTGRLVIFFEDFESGMPLGWQVIDGNSDGCTWTVGTTDDLFLPPPNYGTAYAYYSDDDAGENAPSGTEYLISPSLDCIGLTDLFLSYSWAFTIFDPPIGASYVSFHDGSTWGSWDQLATYYVDSSGVDTFDLTTYLPADSVQVQFTYEDPTGGWGWAFGIDNVLLEVPQDHDVGVASIEIPWYIPTDTSFHPQANVKNYGLNIETFDVTCEISPGAYISTETVSNIDPGNVTLVTFPDSFAFESGLFTVTVYTQLVGDENPLNDTLIKEITASDWLIYDDGFAYGGAYWFDAGNGWGVQFPVTEDWWVDSIACYFDSTWPSPGDTTATFRIYDGAATPTNVRWESISTTIQRGVWNYIGVDTSGTWFTSGDNVFFFYFQVQPGPACPALSFDWAIDFPQYDWYCTSGTFSNGNMWGGDWLMRIHFTTPAGINEWVSLTPDEFLFKAPVITSSRVSLAFTLPQATEVELSVYDAAGRKCATLIKDYLGAGDYSRTYMLDLADGVYFYNLKTESGIDVTKKFIIVQ